MIKTDPTEDEPWRVLCFETDTEEIWYENHLSLYLSANFSDDDDNTQLNLDVCNPQSWTLAKLNIYAAPADTEKFIWSCPKLQVGF